MFANFNYPAYVIEEYLYNMDTNYTGMIPCEIVGFLAYPDQTCTIEILIPSTGAIFSDIPIEALVWKQEGMERTLKLNDLVYNNNKTTDIEIFVVEKYKTFTPKCFFVRTKQWINAEYICSIDFYTGNDRFNFMKLENGQFAFVPNHKINWNGDEQLPLYKKNRQEWKI